MYKCVYINIPLNFLPELYLHVSLYLPTIIFELYNFDKFHISPVVVVDSIILIARPKQTNQIAYMLHT